MIKKEEKSYKGDSVRKYAKKVWLLASLAKHYDQEGNLNDPSVTTDELIDHFFEKLESISTSKIPDAKRARKTLEKFLNKGVIDKENPNMFTAVALRFGEIDLPKNDELAKAAKENNVKALEQIIETQYPEAYEGYEEFKSTFASPNKVEFKETDRVSIGSSVNALKEMGLDKAGIQRFLSLLDKNERGGRK